MQLVIIVLRLGTLGFHLFSKHVVSNEEDSPSINNHKQTQQHKQVISIRSHRWDDRNKGIKQFIATTHRRAMCPNFVPILWEIWFKNHVILHQEDIENVYQKEGET